MRDVTFGQYYPSESPVHRLDPRTKLLLTIAFVVMIFFAQSFISYGALLLLLIAVVIISRVPVTSVLKSVRPVLFLIVFTTLINLFFYNGSAGDEIFSWRIASWWTITWYWQGLIAAGKLALRLFLIIMASSLLTLTTTPVSLTDGIEKLLSPLKVIRFPVHELAIIMSIALRLIPTLIEETDKIMTAQKSRGADFDTGNLFKRAKAMLPVLIPLFVSSFRRADELAFAMDSRCYRGSTGRTKMKVLKFSAGDLVAAIVILAFLAGIIIVRYNFFGIPAGILI